MKRFLSSMLILLLIISIVPITGFSASIYEPVFSIENTEIPLVNPGSDTSITFYLKNSGGSAQSVTMTPMFDGEGPFKANGLTNSILIPNVNSNKTPIKLNLSVSPDSKGGTYPIKLTFDYRYIEPSDIPLEEGESYKPELKTGSKELIIYVKINDQTTQPRLIITEISTNPEVIMPGQKFKLNVLFENKGSLEAKNVNAKLIGLKSDGGFIISEGSDIHYIKSVRGNYTSYVTYELKAANNIKRGSQELDLSLSYSGLEAELQKIYLNVGGIGNQNSNLIMENITYPTNSIGQNKEVDISFDLRNQGQMDARDVIIKAESTDQTGLVSKSVSTIKLLALEAGATKTLDFKFITTRSGETKNYPISITVEYVDDLSPEDEKYSLNQFVGVFVVAPVVTDPKDEVVSVPRLIIDRYDFVPGLVPAGENFSMNLSFFNTNSEKTVKNIKIFLTSNEKTDANSNSGGGSVFTPVDSSNTFYIDSIPPKGRVEKTITMFTVPDAQAKTYTMTANFEYEDNKGKPYTAEELIGVPVIQQSKLETGEINVFEAYIGEPAPISLEFYNTGKVTLYNMMVKLDGDFQTENGSYYIGNFASGGSEFFEGMVIPSEPGELKGDVVFTYEDSTGQAQEIRKPFSLNVMEAPAMPEFPDGEFPPMDEGGSGFSNLIKSPWLWAAVIVIGGIVGFVIYKKKKKQKDLDLDE